MKEVRIGLIGTGLISHRHMKVWSQIPGVKIVAGCDIVETRLQDWGAKYNIADLYADYRQMLLRDDLDAVDVCVHNNLHLPLSLAVLRAGKHCYCEKPMTGSYADAVTMYKAQNIYNRKLAIQISSIFNLQSRMGRDMIQNGELGRIYHARSVGHRRVGRPGVDMPVFSPDFYSAAIGGHGPIFDLGVYRISQLLFMMGLPKLQSVYGAAYHGIDIDERLLRGRQYEVEDLGVGLARYEGGLTLDIIETWAINIDQIGPSFIAGSKGGLKILATDTFGGQLSNEDLFLKNPQELEFYGYENGRMVDKKMNVLMNHRAEMAADPHNAVYNDNQRHWLAYLTGELTDETRYDTPWLAMQTALVSEGIFLSNELGRSVTADEIESLSVSTAVRRQETDWGVLEYDF